MLEIHSTAIVDPEAKLGDNVKIGPYCIIGPHVEIGANTTVDRGAVEDTVIENGVKLDNLIQVAHNVRIGEHTVVAGCTGIARLRLHSGALQRTLQGRSAGDAPRVSDPGAGHHVSRAADDRAGLDAVSV